VSLITSGTDVPGDHLVRAHEAGIDEASGQPWFTSDLLEGEDLATRIATGGALPFPEVGVLVDALGDALGAAHARGLVHYDLTPENVHLGSGTPFSVKLCELTVSRFVSDACALQQDLIGTAIWMAPEQFDLGRVLTPGANVWSLGLLAFYAATGRAYWKNASDDPTPSKELIAEVLRDPIVVASERAGALGCDVALPASFDAWFARCVVRDVSGRFADAREGLAAFRNIGWRGATQQEPQPVARPREGPSPEAAPKTPTPPGSVTPPNAAEPVRSAAPRTGGRRYLLLAAFVVAVGAALCGWTLRRQAASACTRPVVGTGATPGLPATPPAVSSAPAPLPALVAAPKESPAALPADASLPRNADTATTSYAFAAGGSADGSADGVAAFDVSAALRAVSGVYYGNCHVPSPGRLVITFAPSGHVKKVDIAEGDYDQTAARCIAARFSAATIPAFRGGAQPVMAKITSTD
jgi:hypothetical protein